MSRRSPPTTMRQCAAKNETAASGSMDIFGSGDQATIALIGTSYSDKPISNFAGYIEHLDRRAPRQYSISAATSSVRSSPTSPRREFQEQTPALPIWENPIYTISVNTATPLGPRSWRHRLANAARLWRRLQAAENAVEADLSDDQAHPRRCHSRRHRQRHHAARPSSP